jgi:hypothetical protein
MPDWRAIFDPSMPVAEILAWHADVHRTSPDAAHFRAAGSGRLGLHDLLVIVLIAEAAAHALGEYQAIPDGLMIVATILARSVAIDAIAWRWPSLGRLLKPRAKPLIEDGALNGRRFDVSDDQGRRAVPTAACRRHLKGQAGLHRAERNDQRPASRTAARSKLQSHRQPSDPRRTPHGFSDAVVDSWPPRWRRHRTAQSCSSKQATSSTCASAAGNSASQTRLPMRWRTTAEALGGEQLGVEAVGQAVRANPVGGAGPGSRFPRRRMSLEDRVELALGPGASPAVIFDAQLKRGDIRECHAKAWVTTSQQCSGDQDAV